MPLHQSSLEDPTHPPSAGHSSDKKKTNQKTKTSHQKSTAAISTSSACNRPPNRTPEHQPSHPVGQSGPKEVQEEPEEEQAKACATGPMLKPEEEEEAEGVEQAKARVIDWRLAGVPQWSLHPPHSELLALLLASRKNSPFELRNHAVREQRWNYTSCADRRCSTRCATRRRCSASQCRLCAQSAKHGCVVEGRPAVATHASDGYLDSIRLFPPQLAATARTARQAETTQTAGLDAKCTCLLPRS